MVAVLTTTVAVMIAVAITTAVAAKKISPSQKCGGLFLYSIPRSVLTLSEITESLFSASSLEDAFAVI